MKNNGLKWMRFRLGVSILLFGSMILGLTQCERSSSKNLKNEIHGSLVADIRGFDPIQASDAYSHVAINQVYQGLLQYQFLARPYALEPLLAVDMPEVSKDQTRYTFRIRSDVLFHEDPAFHGKPRKLRAQDFVYSIKRLADPYQKSPMWWVLEGRIRGLDAFREKRKKVSPDQPYDEIPVEGIFAPDDETLVFHLTQPYRQFLYVLAMAPTKVVAKEVVRAYQEEFLNHPVGTGPFVLKQWRRGQKIVFDRNSHYWNETYPSQASNEDAGKRLPLVDRLTLWIYTESQPQWLNFLKGNLDLGGIPKEAFDSVFDEHMNVKKDILNRGIVVEREEGADVVFQVFNMRDPLLGKNKALRKAISMALNRKERIRLFYNNRAILAKGPIPPGLFGYDPNLKDPNAYNPKQAKVWMQKAKAQYLKNGGEGNIPTLTYDLTSSTTSRQMGEAIAYDLSQIGLNVELRGSTWPQLNQRMAKGQTMFFGYAWSADYPDPENFLQLLYSENVSPGPNHANFQNDRYDELYRRMRDMPDSPERAEIVKEMVRIIHEEVPWAFLGHRLAFPLRQGWVRNYKRNPFSPGAYKYLGIDLKKKQELLPRLK